MSPVTVIKGDEFRTFGATNVEDVLNQLPQVDPSQGEFMSAGATGSATVDLRGLGPVRTLVLVNGRRLMPGDPRYPVPDLNSLPSALIQRVDVVTGGAAAVYGSDAVAGVVNFILDTKLQGLKVEGEIGGFQHDNRDALAQGLLDQRQLSYPRGSVFDGWRKTLSAAFGHSFFGNRAHLTLYAGYRHIDAVTQDRRDYGACPITARLIEGKPSPILECGGPLVSYPGNYFDNLGNTYQVTPDRTFVPGISRFNSGAWNYYQRPDRRFDAGGFANFDISKAMQAYVEVMSMNDRTTWQIGPSGDFRNTRTVNCDNPLLSAQQRSLICRNGNFVGEIPAFDAEGNLIGVIGSPTTYFDPVTGEQYSRAWLAISLRNIESGPIQDDLRHNSTRLLGGLKGEVGRGISYDASYLYGRARLNRQYRNNLSITRMGRALDVVPDPLTGQPICRSVLIARELGAAAPGADANCVPWDVFAIGKVTAQSTAYLSIPPSMTGSLAQRIGNLNATVELDRWGIGSPWSNESSALNVGVEFRKDSLEFDPDEFASSGDIAGFGDQVYVIQGSTSTKELFGEIRIPLVADRLVRRLAVEGGFRKSWNSNPRSRFSSNSYKLALDLMPVRGLRVRASQQGAIRAPNVQELFAPPQPDAFNRDPCAGVSPDASPAECALTGVTASQYGHITKVNTSFGYSAIIGGNDRLLPETADTRAIGVVFQPRLLPGFSATVDWWDIQLKGAVSKIGAQTVLDNCIGAGDPDFCGRVHRDKDGSLALGDGYVDNRLANLGALKASGIDGSANYHVLLGQWGSADFVFRGGYVLRWVVDNGGLSKPYDCAGLFGAPCTIHVRWKQSARATWNSDHGVSVSLQWRHLSAVNLAALDPKFNLADQVSAAGARLGAQDYVDIATIFSIRKGFQLRLGINNVLDRKPPLVIGNTPAGDGPLNGNTYPEWYDPLGRFVFVSAAVNFKP